MWIRHLLFVMATSLVVTGYAATVGKDLIKLCPGQAKCRHVYDAAGALSPSDVPRFEDYMRWILRESDVDIRFAFIAGTGTRSIEEVATDVVDELRIGGKTGQERGVLLLYDMQGRRLKMEVGYGLEGYFPDAFVSYLVRDHAQQFFESGDLGFGLRLLLRLLQHRVREAVLGTDFDPRVLKAVRSGGYLSGGAGVTARMPSARSVHAKPTDRMSDPDRALYRAGSTPTQTYTAYLAWLSHRVFDPNVDLFTPASRGYLASLPLSPAYRQFILFGEYGKTFKLVERGDLALLYFTNTPFTSPHFFVKEGGAWRMDMNAEVRNTRERVGGPYTWDYRGRGDEYTRAFSDLLFEIGSVQRIKDGDNRPLVIRGSKRL